jgi:predicted acetyltransferase
MLTWPGSYANERPADTRAGATCEQRGPLQESLHYRFAREEEIDEVGRLIAHSFPSPTRTPESWHEQLRDPIYGGGPGTLLLGQESGRTVAALQIHPLHQWVAGEALPMAGVGTVAISPAHRRRRLGAELVSAALRLARERGDVASALYPFRTSFYRNLGYGLAGEALQYQLPPSALPDSEERIRVEMLETEPARGEALELYGRWAIHQNGQLQREKRLWTHLCGAPARGLAGYRARDGALEGYAMVTYRTDLPPDKRFLDVEELVWVSPEARRGLYAWLSSLGDQWQQLLIRALPSQRFVDWVSEPRLPYGSAPEWRLWAAAATLMLGPMFRLLDLDAAWARRRIAPAPSLSLALEVADAQLKENSGTLRLVLEDGRAEVQRPARKSDPTLRLNVSTLSRLFIGSLSGSTALEAGLLETDSPGMLASLDAALALPEPWMFDRF